MKNISQEIEKELYLRNALEVEGIRFDADIFKEVLEENPNIASYHACMDFSTDDTTQIAIPSTVRFENGIGVAVNKNSASPYSFEKDGENIYIVKNGEALTRISFDKTPDYYDKQTTDGVRMNTICSSGNLSYGEGYVMVAYSDECALKDKGHDCLFCNINATRARFAEKEKHQWKYPKQIAETVKAAFEEGYDHFNITGGFIPERRELEYYIDVAEAIQDATDLEDFNGTAVIGAPADLTVLERYKEAGYRTIAIHPEVWGEAYFNAICPGKAEVSGGYQKYMRAIEYAVQVFGKRRVRTQFVAGLQPKAQIIEGLETLAEKGAIPLSLQWVPNIGSALEGHRTPTVDWHWEVQKTNYEILKKNQITYEQLYDVLPGTRLLQDFYRAEAGYFPHKGDTIKS